MVWGQKVVLFDRFLVKFCTKNLEVIYRCVRMVGEWRRGQHNDQSYDPSGRGINEW